MLTCQILSRSVYSVTLWRRKTPFLRYFWLRHSVVSTSISNLRKLSTGTQLQTFPYPMVSKSFLYSNAVMAKSGTCTLTFKSMMDRQTEKKTKKLNVFGLPGGGWNPSPTKLGMVSEDFNHILAPQKLSLAHSFAARGRWKFGNNQTPST